MAARQCDPASLEAPDFREVFEAEHDFVLRTLFHLGVPSASLDDALQEVFLVFYKRMQHFDSRLGLRSWLWGIARRVAASQRRTEVRAGRRGAQYQVGAGPRSPEQAVNARQAADMMARCLSGLSAKHRDVYVLSDLEDFTAPEIARTLGIKLGTVYSRLHLARARVADSVARAHKGEGASDVEP